jgi:DNA-directed RNA polymerase subunit RPC12/RpoP
MGPGAGIVGGGIPSERQAVNLTPSQLLLGYLCLFLGIVFVLWMFGGWQASRLFRRYRETVACPHCGARTARDHAWRTLRCRSCGARHSVDTPTSDRI